MAKYIAIYRREGSVFDKKSFNGLTSMMHYFESTTLPENSKVTFYRVHRNFHKKIGGKNSFTRKEER